MDADGIDIQVLSPMPELLSYWFPANEAEYLADAINHSVAEMVALKPNRFRGFGMAPLQHTDRAIRYMERLRDRFGLVGLQVGSNINGSLIGDASLAPILEAACAHNLALFVHALHPLATKSITSPAWIGPLAGFPIDVGMAAASLILSGTAERFPKLRIGFSHGGGTLSSMLGRMDQGWRNIAPLREVLPKAPSQYAANFFYDSNVYDSSMLKHLSSHIFRGQVFLGTDYPYDIMQSDPRAYIESACISEPEHNDVGRDAALRYLDESSEADFVVDAYDIPKGKTSNPS